jgi:hypothetical protein
MSKPGRSRAGHAGSPPLKILALEPLHGWAISQRLSQISNDDLRVSDGSLYPASLQARAGRMDSVPSGGRASSAAAPSSMR